MTNVMGGMHGGRVAYSATQVGGGNLSQIHRGEASVEASVDADDEATSNQHLEAVGGLGQAHQQRGYEDQDVVEEEPALPAQSGGDDAHEAAAHHAANAEDGDNPGPDEGSVPLAVGRPQLLGVRGLGIIVADLILEPLRHDLISAR